MLEMLVVIVLLLGRSRIIIYGTYAKIIANSLRQFQIGISDSRNIMHFQTKNDCTRKGKLEQLFQISTIEIEAFIKLNFIEKYQSSRIMEQEGKSCQLQ